MAYSQMRTIAWGGRGRRGGGDSPYYNQKSFTTTEGGGRGGGRGKGERGGAGAGEGLRTRSMDAFTGWTGFKNMENEMETGLCGLRTTVCPRV